nr:MAG TPA: hypothetical protein [Caudoviricetes sp.]
MIYYTLLICSLKILNFTQKRRVGLRSFWIYIFILCWYLN